MTFASPLVLTVLALLLPIIVVLHTLRREEHATASLFLWRKVASRRRGSRQRRSVPWTNPLLWLHLAIAMLGVLALAGPRIVGDVRADHVVFLLDASRTMRSGDVDPTRFDAAAAWAIEAWNGSDPGALVSMILVGDEPRIVSARRGTDADLEERLAGARPTDTSPAWPEALELARSLLVAGERNRVVLLSDGATDEDIDAALQQPYAGAGLEVERYSWGGPVVNVGVVGVQVQPRGSAGNRWTVTGDVLSEGLQAGDVIRVQVLFRPQGTETSLPWSGADVAIDRSGSGSFELPVEFPGDGILEIRTAGRDQRPADDVVRRVLRSGAVRTRIALVGPDDPALLAALRAIGGLEVARFDQMPEVEVTRAFDLVIATRATDRPVGTSVFWYGDPPPQFILARPTELPPVATRAPGHPLMRDVDADEIDVASSRSLALPDGAEPLIGADGTVLAWSRTTDVGRQVAFGFGPEESAWASQLSFPAFFASLVAWSRSTEATSVASCRAGVPCPLPRAAYEGDWRIVDAGGANVAASPELLPIEDPYAGSVWQAGAFDRAFVPERAGLYELLLPGGTVYWLAVDAPVERSAATGSVDEPQRAATPETVPTRLQPWRWIAVLVTVLLVVDAVLAWRTARSSLSTRSRSGRAEAIGTLAVLVSAVLFGLAASALVPTLLVRASATHVVLRPASVPTDEGGPVAARRGERWFGWRSADVVVGAARPAAPDPGAERAPPAPVAPNLERGIDLALGLHRGGGPVVIDARGLRIEDVPAREAADLMARSREDGAAIALWSDAGPSNGDDQRPRSRIRDVRIPRVPRAGGAFDLVTDLVPLDRPAVLEVFDEAGAPVDAHRIAPGVAQVRRTLPAGEAGWSTYRVRLAADADADPEAGGIDEARVVVNVAEPLRALVVASTEEVGALLVAGLEAQRIDLDRVAGNRIPATLQRLSAYDVVFLVDVPSSEIHPFHQEMLQAFVRDEGRGLVIVGGSRSFGPGGYYSTVLDDLSPLSSRIEEDMPEVAMTFVLDRSGSMNAVEGDATRLDLAKLATFEAIRLLGERSQAALVAFDTVATQLLPLQSTADLDPFRTALQAVAAGGGTSIYPALVEAYAIVSASDAATRHVIVLTDGLSEEGDFEEILGRIGALGVDTSFVGISNAASRAQLTRLAGYGGGSLHFTNDARALPGILAQEALMLSADPIEERVADPVWSGGAPPEFLGDVGEAAVAPLLGYIRTTAKDEATVLLTDASSEDPLLATWRYGLGRVAAFTSEADGPWSGTWTQQDDFAAFWSQLARWSATTVPTNPYRWSVTARDAVVDVVLDVAPDQADRQAPVAQLLAASSDRVLARTVLAGDGEGRWSGRLGLPEVDGEVYFVRLRTADDGVFAEPREFAFVHRGEASDAPSAIEVVQLDDLGRQLAGDVDGQASWRVAEGRLPFAVPDMTWSGSARWWLLATITAFMLAVLLRFGGLSFGGSRRV